MLAIGRGLLSAPKVLMLDEPSLGLSPRLTNEVFALIREMNRSRGLAILLVEQNTHKALEVANRAYVLELGRKVMEGLPSDLREDPSLRDAYLAGRAEPRKQVPDNFIEPPKRIKCHEIETLECWLQRHCRLRQVRRRRHRKSSWESVAGGVPSQPRQADEIAAQMAVEEINAAGGIGGKKLKIVSFDTAGKPEQAVVGVRKLAEDDKVMAIIGPFSSGECRVVFPAGERSGIVMMSMASSAPKLAEPFTYGLRNTSDEGYMFRNVMKTLQEKKYPIATGRPPTPPMTSSPRPWAKSCCPT